MTLHQRHYRSPLSPSALILARLDRQGAMEFGVVCDTMSIPRDLREQLLMDLLREHYITRDGDRVSITEAGKQLASMPPPPVVVARTPAPRDRASRARTPGGHIRR